MYKTVYFVIALCGTLVANAQFYPSISAAIGFVHTNTEYTGNLGVYNENGTIDLYRIDAELLPIGFAFQVKNTGAAFNKDQKVAIGYSLGLGYSRYTGTSSLIYLSSSTSNQDSIVNAYDHYTFKSNYNILRFENSVDVHWNINESLKFTNSLTVVLSALVKIKTRQASFDGSIINSNHPILGLNYQPQLTKKYKRCWLTYFVNVELFRLRLFEPDPYENLFVQKIPFQRIGFQSIGVRLTPIPKPKPIFEEDMF